MLSVAPVALTLRRLKITRFRDVRPGTELHFSDGWNVLLGRNATGKTTLLHLISMALRSEFEEIGDEPFELEYELGEGDATVHVALSNEFEGGSPSSNDGPGRSFDRRQPSNRRTTLSLRGAADEPPITLTNAPALTPAWAETRWSGKSLPDSFLLSPGDVFKVVDPKRDGARLARACSSWSAQQMWNVWRFDEALGTFRILLGGEEDAPGLPVPGMPAAHGPSETPRVGLPLVPAKARWVLGLPHEAPSSILGSFDRCLNLAWCVERLDGLACRATYPVTELSQYEGGGFHARLGPPTFLLDLPGGRSTSIKHLSFGQKRLFAFAWYLDSNPGPVVADELVNGMHYEWIEDCVRAMEGRQKFVTAQNPLLLDHVGFESPEDVTRSFVLCRAEPLPDNRREVVWTHPSETQAREFFRAYENGVLRVHEILRTEGLW